MSKRQKRFNTINSIQDNYSELSGKKVNIVLKNNSTLFVRLVKIDADKIATINPRGGKAEIALRDISEIILDFKG